ncbi:MAG: HAD family hydrolase [Oxalicibacterium faecigallinarum]|uniref:Haloacid dehalogenase n=1 Tax=Oxalicibacterium faecigallinarum TaxID=573741 RepID=A0A8J3AW29_9BURK|nr:HAD family hydrolase [Oxalicibacterium faecigallinarum]MDQ7969570.1 HAD family hydrolase [Oxalicibacterium faecigallinarum]GGI20402.1 haloacid dehalogenase [Oxalicibacterium faecigallinarum]
MNLALFDLDHTLLPIDSDHEWGEFLVRKGAVDETAFRARNDAFYEQYAAGVLDPVAYLEFALGTLASFSKEELDNWQLTYMREVIEPQLLPAAHELVKKHQDAGDLVAIVTATNRFITAPIAQALGVEHLIAAEPECGPNGCPTGKLLGEPTYGPGKIAATNNWLASRGQKLEDFPRSWFYSDSQNDIPLMSLVTDPVATNPNARLTAHAQAHGWPIIRLFEQQ